MKPCTCGSGTSLHLDTCERFADEQLARQPMTLAKIMTHIAERFAVGLPALGEIYLPPQQYDELCADIRANAVRHERLGSGTTEAPNSKAQSGERYLRIGNTLVRPLPNEALS